MIKRFFLLIAILILVSNSVISQHLIILKNRETINCKITNIDSTKFYIDLVKDDKIISTCVNKSDVASYQYTGAEPIVKRSAFTWGVLQGGGSLIGIDVEKLMTNRFGVQAGVGLVGFGFGLNMHFKPKIQSSFISLQYWHQGVSDNYTQSVGSLNFVFRARKVLTFQIGLGGVLKKGPAYKSNMMSELLLTYALGLYFPTR